MQNQSKTVPSSRALIKNVPSQDLPLLTHGFGTYPAGMQPAAAAHLLKTILPGKTVFGKNDCALSLFLSVNEPDVVLFLRRLYGLTQICILF